MRALAKSRGLTVTTRPGLTIYHRPEIEPERVLDALSGGEILKESSKSLTRKVGDWLVKSSRFDYGRGPLKHTVFRSRYRRAWRAAWRLQDHGIQVPAPYAMVERHCLGAILGNTFISGYLDGFVTVEEYAGRLVAAKASPHDVRQFLADIADAINALCAAGAYHADLSGKNILTNDGKTFYFIDLDTVVLDRPCSDRLRMKTHIQLYDSFCDRWGIDHLGPFVQRMLPSTCDQEHWLDAVQAAQQARRARQIERWRKQGRLP